MKKKKRKKEKKKNFVDMYSAQRRIKVGGMVSKLANN
jgi:hypothetical protein